MKFDNRWSLANVITIGVLAASIFYTNGNEDKEREVLKERVGVNALNIREHSVKIDKLENNQIGMQKDIEAIRESNERMEVKINKILDKMNIID